MENVWPKAIKKLSLHLVLWAALLLCLWFSFPKRIGTVWKIEGGSRKSVRLPSFGEMQPGEQIFLATLLVPSKKLSVRADESVELLEVDGLATIAAKPLKHLRNRYRDLPLLEHLTSGTHTLLFSVQNSTGEQWFDIKEAHGLTWRTVLCLFVLGIGAFVLINRAKYGLYIGWPVALAGLLALQYVEVTTPWVRQHDVDGHRQYVEHLSRNIKLPSVMQGSETWQPPLYYYGVLCWQWLFSKFDFGDTFRPVQFLSAVLYIATVLLALITFRRMRLNDLQTASSLGILAFVPGHLFFAGRINNDTLLPVLGAAVLLATVEFVRHGERHSQWWLMVLMPTTLATKGSSLAVCCGSLAMVFWSELRRSGWQRAFFRAYLIGLPAGIWLLFWWTRNVIQTGDPLYVNYSLLESLRIDLPAWQRLLSFDFKAFVSGAQYFDNAIRLSYPTALVTSLLYGEYRMDEYEFYWSRLLRLGCLGMLLLLAVGTLVRPRAELRAVWATCLCLAICQLAISVAYAITFPFACNQNMRFFAQAFVPISCIWGLGVCELWQRTGLAGRGAIVTIVITFLLGLGEFYFRILF